MRDQWSTSGAAGGEPWAPLSPAYAAWKARHRPGRGILYFDGDLRGAASRPGRDAGPQTLTLTIRDEKAGWHQEGTGRMPARRIIPDGRLPEAWLADLHRAAQDYVDEVAKREGL